MVIKHGENSDVLPSASAVAVAVKYAPTVNVPDKEKLTLPEAGVVTLVSFKKTWPSPLPDGWQTWLSKNCSIKLADGVLLS